MGKSVARDRAAGSGGVRRSQHSKSRQDASVMAPREMNKVLTGDVGELLIGIDVHLRR
jgi:hypothetical protein